MEKEKVLYFDCASGISGDMTLGALLDLGVDEHEFLAQLALLGLDEYEIRISETLKNGIRAKHVDVIVKEAGKVHGEHRHGEPDHGHDLGHSHEHAHGRNFADIRELIGRSALAEDVKELALRIFGRVAGAEAKVHGETVDEVHFHEVGAVDSIVDIVGCAVLIRMIDPAHIYASEIHEGHGFVKCAHGLLSVPVPATSEILATAEAPCRQIDVEGELVTPTGAAIISELAESFGVMPQMKMKKIGWGAGTKDFAIPNVLKVYMGSAEQAGEQGIQTDEIIVLETNLDDCTGEMMGYAIQKLLQAGALDAFCEPIYMKKNRPAYRLTVLARPEDADKLETVMFRCTTTIGIRKRREQRSILKREEVCVDTLFGVCRGKKVEIAGETRVYPEYEDAVAAAEANQVSLWEIYKSYEK